MDVITYALLKKALKILQPPATSADIGKSLTVKSVEDGKVTEYEFSSGGGGGYDYDDIQQIIEITDDTTTLSDLATTIAAVNTAGKHVFFDVSALSYPLYLCTIAIIYDDDTPVSYRLNDLVSGSIAMGAYNGSKTLATILSEAVNSFYTLIVTAVTQDGVTVTGQTVTVRKGSASGAVYATASYNGQPVSFSLPNGFDYYVSISDTLSAHFNPSTASGVISDADVAVTLTYSDFSSIATIQDVQAALDAGLDLSSLVGLKTISNIVGSTTYEWDIADYDNTNYEITCVLHDTLADQRQFDPPQALAWFENGLAAGSYYFTHNNTNYYFTLANAIPSGGQLRATTSAFQTYASPTDTATVETGTVGTTEISGATLLGTTASDSGTYTLNHMDRVNYGSNNYAEAGLLEWLNSDDASGTVIVGKTKFDRPFLTNVAGFLYGWSAEDLACIADTVWKCSANNVYECPASMGGLTVKSNPYTVTKKIGLLSEMEVFGSYGGVADGSTLLDLYNGADASDRIKYYNNSARIWWLRSPYWSLAYGERGVGASGTADRDRADSSIGVAPAFKIRKSA